ncbi:MAG: SDR family oxidoreductase [Thauera sp.]|jgi:NAD(P)-dependent dehydrogenase (short-subunit alcohol dehydrogenase family)|nr:SDR family oxidoreductase [Thauera sp.]
MRKAIVSGHSRGLGAALSRALVAAGFEVLGLSRQSSATLAAACGDKLQQCELDLADSNSLLHWLESETLARWCAGAELAVLVNNAGTVQPMGLLGTLDAATQAQAIALNVSAPLLLSDAFCRWTASCPDRRIVHISSGAGRQPYAGWSTYCTTKAALDHHARTVAVEAHPGLRIASLAPGIVDTDMQGEIRATSAEHFPLRGRFVALHRDGALSSPAASAAQVLAKLLAADFGENVIADVRG